MFINRFKSLSFSAIVLSTCAAVAWGQQVKHPGPSMHASKFKIVQPVHHSNITPAQMQAVKAQSASATTIPLWNYSVVAGQDSNTYTGIIVGRSPYYHGLRSTTIQAYLIPVVFTFPDGSVFDPTATDACITQDGYYNGVSNDSVMDLLQNSPIFQTADYTLTDANGNNPVDVGTTQYADATQRANYWNFVAPAGNNVVLPYHTLVALNTLPAVNVTLPNVQPGQSGYAFTQVSGSCSGYEYGVIDYNWWDNYVTTTLIPSLSGQGVGPTTLPIFVFDSVVMYLNGNYNSGIYALGDHGGYLNNSNVLQTYIVTGFDSTGDFGRPDISILGDELAKWINDPAVTNSTPAWESSVGAMANQCENILELGDPVTGLNYNVSMPPWPAEPNGFPYYAMEIAYFWWFYDLPSQGAGGWYSDQGTLTSDAGAVCSGGGGSYP
jgi:hypothetical protein